MPADCVSSTARVMHPLTEYIQVYIFRAESSWEARETDSAPNLYNLTGNPPGRELDGEGRRGRAYKRGKPPYYLPY